MARRIQPIHSGALTLRQSDYKHASGCMQLQRMRWCAPMCMTAERTDVCLWPLAMGACMSTHPIEVLWCASIAQKVLSVVCDLCSQLSPPRDVFVLWPRPGAADLLALRTRVAPKSWKQAVRGWSARTARADLEVHMHGARLGAERAYRPSRWQARLRPAIAPPCEMLQNVHWKWQTVGSRGPRWADACRFTY